MQYQSSTAFVSISLTNDFKYWIMVSIIIRS